MRLGLLEIGIIIAVAIIIFGITRIIQLGKNSARKTETSIETAKQKGMEETKRSHHPRVKITGIVLIVIGIVITLVSVNLLKWVFWSNIWAFIIVAIGLAVLFISRHK